MGEIRRQDGTTRWRGEDPAECLAAVLALGDEAGGCSIIGFDSSDLPTLPDDEAKREAAIGKLPKAKLISERPKPTYRVVNESTGAAEQVFEKKADAEKAARKLNDVTEHETPGDVPGGFEPVPKHEGRLVRFRVEG